VLFRSISRLLIDVTEGNPSPQGVPFTITLTNNGNQRIGSIRLFDENDKRINESEFSLSVGESRQFSYTATTEENERYVVFRATGATPGGDSYETNTESYIVRKYIDPSLIGIDCGATVVEPLNAAGSIKLRFTLHNTGELTMQNLVISEQTEATAEDGTTQAALTELYRADSVAPGESAAEIQLYVGEPRDLTFVIALSDPAGNPYTYNAYISADHIGVYDGSQAQAAQQTVIEALGANAGAGLAQALDTVLLVLGALFGAAIIALLVLRRLEIKEKRALARKRALRERQRRREGL
jgi:hypothetical protein